MRHAHYELGRLSAGAASELAGVPKPVFLSKLADYGDAGVSVEKVGHSGLLQRLHRRQWPLVGTGKLGIGDEDRIEETVRPRLRFQWLKDDRLPVVTDSNRGGGNVKAFRQAHGLPLTFVDDVRCLHDCIRLILLLRMPTYHGSGLGVKFCLTFQIQPRPNGDAGTSDVRMGLGVGHREASWSAVAGGERG